MTAIAKRGRKFKIKVSDIFMVTDAVFSHTDDAG